MPEKIDLESLVESLDLSEELLSQAMLNQAKLFLKASKYRVIKMKERMVAESTLNHLRLDAAAIVRTRDYGEVRITEKFIEEQVSKNAKVRAAEKNYDQAKAVEEYAKLLLDSFRERGSMCKAIVQLIGAEAAVESGFVRAELERMGVGRLSEKVRSRYPGRAE